MFDSTIRIKMCGMTRREDIDKAINLGVDAIGLIFFRESRRRLTIKQAKELLEPLPLFINNVAVLVNPTKEEVHEIINELPIHWLQFHGNETPEFCSQFDKPYIKGIAALSTDAIEKSMKLHSQASAFLLDTPANRSYGGTGKSFDWQIIPKKCNKPIILAGGLTSTTVLAAAKEVMPAAVDVCTGIETCAGIKDHNKMRDFVKALRGDNEL